MAQRNWTQDRADAEKARQKNKHAFLATLAPASIPTSPPANVVMNIAGMNDLLAHVTHRPGYTLEVHNGGFLPCLTMKMAVVDTYHPENTIPLEMHQAVPKFIKTPEDFYDFCLGTVMWFDTHECREWFKIDGKPYRDPHAWATMQRFDVNEVFAQAKAMRPDFKTSDF